MTYFYLTVARDGVVSLWDTIKDAHTAKRDGESFVLLTLTKEQRVALNDAKMRATVNNQNGPIRPDWNIV